ncbi:RPM1 interacting protein 13-like [Corylus avellana]|uniref:RPM1 interacting protein 13-like n=1 Tax=Corylus avellana TaxID=13451 RepID=UPI00286CBB71|nr:RPM1 interacting protein 13-like [Corylus avellana]
MSENDTELVQILPFSSEKKEEGEEEDGSPIRSIFCLKSKSPADIKRIEEIEDCFILEFDPYESIDLSKFTVPADADGATHLFVIAEKGQVACRDYPHSRHLCLNFPFEATPHENYCNLCYCYVCDSAAPCKYWTEPIPPHCDASENVEGWMIQRNLRKRQEGFANELVNSQHLC